MEQALVIAWNIFLVCAGLGFIVFVHELGHFLLAKKVGIRVEKFYLGFDPWGLRILRFTAGGTEYGIGLVFLGGYVKMAGEGPDAVSTGAADEFSSKSVWERAQVIVAGVCMNAVFSVLMFIIAFSIGVRFPVPRVGEVREFYPASGVLERGDEILSVDGKPVITFMDVMEYIAVSEPEKGVTLEVRRGDRVFSHTLRPRAIQIEGLLGIGVERLFAIAEVEPDSAAARAGMEPGDVVMTLDGEPIASALDFEDEVFLGPGRTMTIGIDRAKEDGGIERRTLEATCASKPFYAVGITFDEAPVVAEVVPGSPAEQAGLQQWDVIRLIGEAPASPENLRALVQELGDHESLLTIERAGKVQTLPIRPSFNEGQGTYTIGVLHGGTNLIKEVTADGPAAKLGLVAGDYLVSYGELRTARVTGMNVDKLNCTMPVTYEVSWRHGDETKTGQLEPVEVSGRFWGDLGIRHDQATFIKKSDGIVDAVALGWQRTVMVIRQIFRTLEGLISSKISASALSGPVMITRVSYHFAKSGMGTLLYFLALLSMNLAIINILPVPILDGGHLVFLLIEKLKGSPVPEQFMAYAQYVGLILLLALMIFVTTNDLLKIFF